MAIEALREVVQQRRQYQVTIPEITEMARQCRVGEVMHPYIEALLG